MEIKRKRFNSNFGFIDYHFSFPGDDQNYPNGLFLFLGSYIEIPFRKQGKFKEMLKELLFIFPEGVEIQAAVANKKLVTMFGRLGLNKVNKKIEYWGDASNTTKMIGNLNHELLEKL